MSGAAWVHTVWDESLSSTEINGSPVTLTTGTTDTLPSDVASTLETAWQAALATLTVSWSSSSSAFTISNSAGVFTTTLPAALASLLGYSTTSLAGASSYTSDQRPEPWILWSWPLESPSVSFGWQRRGRVVDELYVQCEVRSGPHETWTHTVTVPEAERSDTLAWLAYAMERRGVAIWPLTTDGDTAATAANAWRLREHCLLTSSDAPLLRNGPVRRLYSLTLTAEVVSDPVLA